jgi:hypothetical protein
MLHRSRSVKTTAERNETNKGYHNGEDKRKKGKKKMHGKLLCNLDEKVVDNEQSYR